MTICQTTPEHHPPTAALHNHPKQDLQQTTSNHQQDIQLNPLQDKRCDEKPREKPPVDYPPPQPRARPKPIKPHKLPTGNPPRSAFQRPLGQRYRDQPALRPWWNTIKPPCR
ncbi:hypothetical protein RHMOL_Rhmol02G0171000 [Rhododendron molle]|uniref:Uncharacterized protein n=1 Tax=Rhododendron molle TaxID=49168 RepID=A0ACC0PSH0_RHOML|nr:hypothetical protein RHMOL_Rhmol02G0171000 [Rhododendron molle]